MLLLGIITNFTLAKSMRFCQAKDARKHAPRKGLTKTELSNLRAKPVVED
jgi:hypothetical protein